MVCFHLCIRHTLYTHTPFILRTNSPQSLLPALFWCALSAHFHCFASSMLVALAIRRVHWYETKWNHSLRAHYFCIFRWLFIFDFFFFLLCMRCAPEPNRFMVFELHCVSGSSNRLNRLIGCYSLSFSRTFASIPLCSACKRSDCP